jgi:hypothetical protein
MYLRNSSKTIILWRKVQFGSNSGHERTEGTYSLLQFSIYGVLIDRYDNGTTPASIYDINQLEAMQMADLAWHEIDTFIGPGVLSRRNCLSLDELLNLAEEDEVIESDISGYI